MTTETNTPEVSFRPVTKNLVTAVLAGGTPMEFLPNMAAMAGADELKVPSDLGDYGEVPETVTYNGKDGKPVVCAVVADANPMAEAVGHEKANREIIRARKAESAEPKPKREKQKRRVTHFATRFQTAASVQLVFGWMDKASTAAQEIADKAKERGAEIIVVPAQVVNHEDAQNALTLAGIHAPESGQFPQWSADPNWQAREPKRKPQKGKRRPQAAKPKLTRDGRTVNPYQGMTTAQAKEAAAKAAARRK